MQFFEDCGKYHCGHEGIFLAHFEFLLITIFYFNPSQYFNANELILTSSLTDIKF